MPTVTGKAEVKAHFASVPTQMIGVLRGAARAGAKVIADEVKTLTPSDDVRDAARMRTKQADGRIVTRIDTKPGWARSLGTWLEYGTSPHLISVDEGQRNGMSIGRINRLANEPDSSHSLVIGGKFVGSTVFHPGARPHPAFRPALDNKETEARAEAQRYINTQIRGGRIAPEAGREGDSA